MGSGYKNAAAAMLLVAVSGCAFQKQAIQLQPKVEGPTTTIGMGKMTMVQVADERPRTTLGTRGVGGIGEQLTIDGELSDTIRRAVSDGLKKQGFAVDGPIENQLRVEIRNLDYTINSGFWAGKLNIEFLLKGVCIKGNARPYEQMYRGEMHKSIQVVQGADSNNQFVNQVVSDAVKALLMDETMMRCLA